MATTSRFRSDVSEAIHSPAGIIHKVTAFEDATMHDFDGRYMVVFREIEPAEIKQLREANNVSQRVFAGYLNTSKSTVEKWETGAKRPSGMALKLLTVVKKHGLEVLA